MYLTCFSTTRVSSAGNVLDEELDPPTPGPATSDMCMSKSYELRQPKSKIAGANPEQADQIKEGSEWWRFEDKENRCER